MAEQHELNTQISLPLSKAVEISFNSVKIRFGRSLITVSGIVLAIAFLMSIWAGNAIIDGLMGAGDPKINLILQQKGVEIDPDSAAAIQQRSKDSVAGGVVAARVFGGYCQCHADVCYRAVPRDWHHEVYGRIGRIYY